MRDGRTRKLPGRSNDSPEQEILANHRFSLVILDGSARGREIRITGTRTLIGRGPGVDVSIPDPAMSRQHFALELTGDHFRLRDLGSTNGIVLNGKIVDSADVGHGDRVKAGDHVFQFLVEDFEPEPPTYIVPD